MEISPQCRRKKATSTFLGCYFDLAFNHAANGLPTGITFTKDDFVRPPRHTAVGSQLVTLLGDCKPAPILVKKQNKGVNIILTEGDSE